MGTSNSFGGPGNGTPLVPSWLEPVPGPAMPGLPGVLPPGQVTPAIPVLLPVDGVPPALPPLPPPGPGGRFADARGDFSRFAKVGSGSRAGRRSLGRAVSKYVSDSAGSPRQAAQRMGSSRVAGGRLLGFLADVARQGAEVALRTLNLAGLAGQGQSGGGAAVPTGIQGWADWKPGTDGSERQPRTPQVRGACGTIMRAIVWA